MVEIADLNNLPYTDAQKAILIALWNEFNQKMVLQNDIQLDYKYTLVYVIDAGLAPQAKTQLEHFLGKELTDLDVVYLPVITYSWMTTTDQLPYLNVLINQTDGISLYMNNYGKSWRLEERKVTT
jgi:hypothetical protein